MNRIASIGTMAVLSAVISGNLVAQQTSSAVQVVTFGVSRTPQTLVHTIASVGKSTSFAPAMISQVLKPGLTKTPVKITFCSKTSEVSRAIERETLNSDREVLYASQFAVTRASRNKESVQKDLRTFTSEDTPAALGMASLLLTITE
jgi:hypothetical protein